MTFKSTKSILEERLGSGELIRWLPSLESDPVERELLVTPNLMEGFDEGTWKDPSYAVRFADLAGDFDRFVTGAWIPVGMDPQNKGADAYLARIEPVEYGIWTIRSVAPSPGMRVFGAFYDVDVFVGLHASFRRNLGGWGSREWMAERENAIARWDSLNLGAKMKTGENIEDFISEKTVPV